MISPGLDLVITTCPDCPFDAGVIEHDYCRHPGADNIETEPEGRPSGCPLEQGPVLLRLNRQEAM